jgi:bacterial/archaeal transporter family-2 protein
MQTSFVISAVLALFAGCAMAIQPGANGTLASALGHSLRGSVVSFATGFAFLLVIATILRVGVPDVNQMRQVPWWGWIGGLLGAFMVTVSLFVAPRMGATVFFAFVLSAQLILAVILDHYGLFGYSVKPVSASRVMGILLLVAGVILVNLSRNQGIVQAAPTSESTIQSTDNAPENPKP